MSSAEIQWRLGAAFRNGSQRAMAVVRPSTWDRSSIRDLLADPARIEESVRTADWMGAHRRLSRQIIDMPQRFLIAPVLRAPLADRIVRRFPDSPGQAQAAAERVADGSFDLLGYRGLRFESGDGTIEWHYDPVNGRRAPAGLFWSAVPFLDPTYGDHKVIWELNRHQYWLVLGRAFWLTGDSRYRELAVAHLESWMAANPPLLGINWASMLELAFRSLSWIWALHLFADDTAGDRSPWVLDLLIGLDRQLEQVERNLSRYFSPNTHLLGEALALYVAGRALPLLAASSRREAIGRTLLIEQIGRQIGADGGHLERSTHYHRYALDFYLLALAVARITGDAAAASEFAPAVERLAHAARVLADDTGVLPHIGDDDGGSTMPITGRRCDDVRDSLWAASILLERPELRLGPPVEEPLWLLAHDAFAPAVRRSEEGPRIAHDTIGSSALPETGYYVSRSRDAHIVIDAGPHGFLNGGHAHADALGMTLTLRGSPLLIDPGTGCYTADAHLRDRLRSSALHNTVVVDGRPQSTPAGPFSWAHTADATVHCWRVNRAFDYLEASHDGYAAAGITHRRHVLVLHDDLIVVADLITGAAPGPRDIQAFWHIGNEWTARVSAQRVALERDRECVTLLTTASQVDLFCGDAGPGEPRVGWHAPVYGRLEPAPTVRCALSGHTPCWLVSVFGIGMNPPHGLRVASSERVGGAPTMAMWIDRAMSVDFLAVASASGEEPAQPASKQWSASGFESDARVLFCSRGQDSDRVLMVDGSFVRCSTGRPFEVGLPAQTPHLQLDLPSGGAGAAAPAASRTVSSVHPLRSSVAMATSDPAHQQA